MRFRHRPPIDAQLSAYVSSTRTTLSARSRSRAGKGWSAYCAAAGVALTMAPAAEALPIYSGLQDIRVTTGPVGLDLDSDGLFDFYFHLGAMRIPSGNEASMTEGPGIGTWYLLRLARGATIAGNNFGRPGYDPQGIRVGPSRTPYSTTYDQYPGGFQPSIVGFGGVRFKKSGQDRFGWIRLHLEGKRSPLGYPITTALLIKDWAYESEPGIGIEAGAGLPPVPEPGGLALLATGAAGIAEWRRRRRQPSQDR